MAWESVNPRHTASPGEDGHTVQEAAWEHAGLCPHWPVPGRLLPSAPTASLKSVLRALG